MLAVDPIGRDVPMQFASRVGAEVLAAPTRGAY
jgi:hypothetical protein